MYKYISFVFLLTMALILACRHSANHVECCDRPQGAKFRWFEEARLDEKEDPIYMVEITDTTFDGARVYAHAYPCYKENYWARYGMGDIIYQEEKMFDKLNPNRRFPDKPNYHKGVYGYYHYASSPNYGCNKSLNTDSVLQTIFLTPLRKNPASYNQDEYPFVDHVPYRGKYAGVFTNRKDRIDTIEIKEWGINLGGGKRTYSMHVYYPTIKGMDSQPIYSLGYKTIVLTPRGVTYCFDKIYYSIKSCGKFDHASKTIEIYYQLTDSDGKLTTIKFNGKKI